ADIVEDVEDDDGVGLGERRRAYVGADDLGSVAERVAGALDVAPLQLDAANADVERRLGPAARPAAVARRARRRGEQAREQPLAAADVEDARARRDHPARQQVDEDRIPTELAAREVPCEAARAAVRRARLADERAPRRDRVDSAHDVGGRVGSSSARAASGSVTAVSPSASMRSSSAGSVATTTATPSA